MVFIKDYTGELYTFWYSSFNRSGMCGILNFLIFIFTERNSPKRVSKISGISLPRLLLINETACIFWNYFTGQ